MEVTSPAQIKALPHSLTFGAGLLLGIGLVLAFESGVYGLVLTALTVEVSVQPSVPRLMKRRKLAVLDEWANTSLTG